MLFQSNWGDGKSADFEKRPKSLKAEKDGIFRSTLINGGKRKGAEKTGR